MSKETPQNSTIKVWDPIVRLGHWLLVLGFIVAYLTGEDGEDWHVWSGYLVGSIVLIRIAWGLIGTRHARFSDFLYSPAQALRYLTALLRGSAKRYIGHSPAGGVMVFMLLAGLLATCGSGLVLQAFENNAGPLAGFVDAGAWPELSPIASAHADDDDDDDEDEHHGEGADEDQAEEFWEEIHEFAANLTLLLVFLHIGGVALASFAHQENLVRAMLNGRKRDNT